MERRGKERLIGAGILVALAVVVVPELLSGPKPEAPSPDASVQLPRPAGMPEPVRTVTVDLNTSKPPLASAQAAPPASPAPQAPETAPPAAPPQVAVVTAPPNAASTPPPAPSHEAAAPSSTVETPLPPPKSAGAYAVQLGTFANRANAENLLHQLKGQGYAAYLSSEGAGAAARYRVRVGPLSDRDAAERTAAKLKAAGHATALIAPH